jgi:small subunit ribosomal protein S4
MAGASRRRGKLSDYGVMLQEKQRVRRTYGILEKQFYSYFTRANHQTGVTGVVLLQLLESRLDNVVYRMGFATSRNQARQGVRHGHFMINGKKVNIPSYHVNVGDVIELIDTAKAKGSFKASLEYSQNRGFPAWVQMDVANSRGTFMYVPERNELDPNIKEQLIVEYYSR